MTYVLRNRSALPGHVVRLLQTFRMERHVDVVGPTPPALETLVQTLRRLLLSDEHVKHSGINLTKRPAASNLEHNTWVSPLFELCLSLCFA